MKTLRLLFVALFAAALVPGPAHAFDLLQSAKDALERKAREKTDAAVGKGVDGAVDSATSGDKGDKGDDQKADQKASKKGGKKGGQPAEEPGDGEGAAAGAATAGAAAGTEADRLKPGQGAWANYDFKPGTRVIFADDFTKDEIGDFPRRLEFKDGNIELVEWNKGRWLRLNATSKFYVPLPEVLPERYTMEFDYSVPGGEMWIYPDEKSGSNDIIKFGRDGACGVSTGNGINAHSTSRDELAGKVVHARVMADGAYVKLYVGDTRCANVPNFPKLRSNKVLFYVDAREESPALFGNFRIAAGGKKLYETLTTAGRVATQGIYFDTGSDHIRPESTPTLKEIAAMLSEHGDLKLLIEGHTDSVGQAAANQALSEKRASAVKRSLVEGFGVDGARLTTKGLGQTKPVAPNETPEGRQNNRRVELVKA